MLEAMRTPSPIEAFATGLVIFHVAHSLAAVGAGRSNPRVALYVISALHALIVSALGLALLWIHGPVGHGTAAAFEDSAALDAVAPGVADAAVGRALASFSFAFFLYDACASLPDWRSHPADLIHHTIGLLLTAACVTMDVPARIGHHVTISELSTPFLDAMWALRQRGAYSSRRYAVVSRCFASTFFLTRIVYLPWFTYVCIVVLRDSLIVKAPLIAPVLLALLGLNMAGGGRELWTRYCDHFNDTTMVQIHMKALAKIAK